MSRGKYQMAAGRADWLIKSRSDWGSLALRGGGRKYKLVHAD